MKKKQKNEEGITIVSLVVTVIILIILAGITVMLILGQSGIINKAQEAKEESTNAQISTGGGLSNLYNDIMLATTEKVAPTTVIDAKNVDIFSDNTKLKDDNGNIVIIPEGFKIANDSATSVTDGIIIQDKYQNQFIWVPVGTIHTKTGDKEIALSRYTFDNNGLPFDQGNNIIQGYYQELASSSYGNLVAKNISDFLEKSRLVGGYYIGRYEGRKNNTRLTENGTDNVWKNMSQTDAATACRNMYSNDKYTSDLINSYAWDTAIVYEETFGNNNYANRTTVNRDFATTGTNNQSTKDVICNIYDMASNCIEWTTETYLSRSCPCVRRGGAYNYPSANTSIQSYYYMGDESDSISLRPIIYIEY